MYIQYVHTRACMPKTSVCVPLEEKMDVVGNIKKEALAVFGCQKYKMA